AEAPDPLDAKVRLRSVLRRVITEGWILVIPRGADRLAAGQGWVTDSEKRRGYPIYHRPAKANGRARQDATRWARSLAAVAPADLDLRRPEDARALEAALAAVDLTDDGTAPVSDTKPIRPASKKKASAANKTRLVTRPAAVGESCPKDASSARN